MEEKKNSDKGKEFNTSAIWVKKNRAVKKYVTEITHCNFIMMWIEWRRV